MFCIKTSCIQLLAAIQVQAGAWLLGMEQIMGGCRLWGFKAVTVSAWHLALPKHTPLLALV